MRELKNDNVNLFLGIVLNSQSTFLSVWKYCQRGSLGDVISSGALTMDAFFVFSIIKDIASVLRYCFKRTLTHYMFTGFGVFASFVSRSTRQSYIRQLSC